MGGYDWLHLFWNRHPSCNIRTTEGISIARFTALYRDTENNYFTVLDNRNSLFDNSGNIFNVDEIGLQLSNKPGQVIAAWGSKAAVFITSRGKSETIVVIACCNGEGNFRLPYYIYKERNW